MSKRMKIKDLVILVKYAQGAVVFNSFLGYVKAMKPSERKIFYSQMVELIGHFAIKDSSAGVAIKQSGLIETCSACLILKDGINKTQLQKILELPESELESSFKLLLTLFSIGYQEGYQKNRNAPEKFWYWDYSQSENAFRVVELDYNKELHLDDVLIH